MSAIITLSSGKASADLILQYGMGTQNPSVMLINHSGEAQIELGDIHRFTDDELVIPKKRPSVEAVEGKTCNSN
jgi:hypothetical protein